MNSQQIKKIVDRYLICKNDRVVLNGGEPLLAKDIVSILEVLNNCGAEVVIYSNGTQLESKKFCEDLVSAGFSRITIPLHGVEKTHDYITRTAGSYKSTMEGIKNLTSMANLDRRKVEIKLIINYKMLDEYDDIVRMLDNEIVIGKIDSLVLSGMVETSVAQSNKICLPNVRKLAVFVENMIRYFREKKTSLTFKIEDICIRYFSTDTIKKMLDDLSKCEHPLYDFYFFDINRYGGDLMEYSEISKNLNCVRCPYVNICPQIEYSYRILKLKNDWCFCLE